MRRLRALLPVAGLFAVLFATQGMMAVGTSTGDELGTPALERAIGSLVRDEGPIMERIPAPVVVPTILAGALIAAGAWYALVRWTDISGEF